MVCSHLPDCLLAKIDWEMLGLARWRSSLKNIVQHLGRANRDDRMSPVRGELHSYVSIELAFNDVSADYVFALAGSAGSAASGAPVVDQVAAG